MEIGRREFLIGTAALSLDAVTSPVGLGFHQGDLDVRWHPLARSLLQRASRVARQVDLGRIELIVHEVSEEQQGRPVIKWMDCAQSAFEHLSRYSVGELSQMPIGHLSPAPPRF